MSLAWDSPLLFLPANVKRRPKATKRAWGCLWYPFVLGQVMLIGLFTL